MSNKEFIQWLKGFTEGVHHFNISPKQWDYLKEKLQQVNTNNNTYQFSEEWTTNIA